MLCRRPYTAIALPENSPKTSIYISECGSNIPAIWYPRVRIRQDCSETVIRYNTDDLLTRSYKVIRGPITLRRNHNWYQGKLCFPGFSDVNSR